MNTKNTLNYLSFQIHLSICSSHTDYILSDDDIYPLSVSTFNTFAENTVLLLYDHTLDAPCIDNDYNESHHTKCKDLAVDLVFSVSAVVRNSSCDLHLSGVVRLEDTPRKSVRETLTLLVTNRT